MNRKRLVSMILLLLLLMGCGGKNAKSSGMWSLGERYPSTYETLAHVYHYTKDAATFFVSELPGKKDAGLPLHAKETIELDGVVYALCESKKKTDNETPHSYFESISETRRVILNSEDESVNVGTLFSLADAAALMRSPAPPPDGITHLSEEWDAYYRTDACNIEIYVYPNDNGKHAVTPSDTYETCEEGGETYLYSEQENAILYTDGTNTVWIRQSNRAGSEHVLYSTLSECKTILALLG